MNSNNAQSTENYARRHYGLLEIIQTVIGGLILGVASVVWSSISKSNDAISRANDVAKDQASDIAVIKAQMIIINSRAANDQSQMAGTIASLNSLQAEIIRMRTKQELDERELEELKQTRKLR